MDATLIAAIIAAGSTGIVAVAGFLTTGAVSRQTIEASTDNTVRALDAAREEQVWQQRAAAYVDAIMAVQWQQGRRHRQLSTLSQGVPLIPESSREAEKPPVDWAELSPRLFAFASLAVLRAFQAASDAGIEARKRYRTWEDSGREARAEQADLEPCDGVHPCCHGSCDAGGPSCQR